MRDVEDARPVVDLVWFHEDYLRLFEAAGLRLLQTHRPLGMPHEPHHWVHEEAVGPWVIYALGKG